MCVYIYKKKMNRILSLKPTKLLLFCLQNERKKKQKLLLTLFFYPLRL